jgi:hypothetical protein
VRLAPIQPPLDLVFLLKCRPRPRHRCFFPLGPFWCVPGFPLEVASPFLILSLVIESGSRTLSVPDSLPGRGVRAVAWNFLAEPECAGQVDRVPSFDACASSIFRQDLNLICFSLTPRSRFVGVDSLLS